MLATSLTYRLLDLTVYGRQETWEDSPAGWPQRFEGKQNTRTNDWAVGRPWSRLEAGYSDKLGTPFVKWFGKCRDTSHQRLSRT